MRDTPSKSLLANVDEFELNVLTVFKGSFLRLQEEVFAKIHRIFSDSDRLTRFALIRFSNKKTQHVFGSLPEGLALS